jgi:hypothetical protein
MVDFSCSSEKKTREKFRLPVARVGYFLVLEEPEDFVLVWVDPFVNVLIVVITGFPGLGLGVDFGIMLILRFVDFCGFVVWKSKR